jgi:hypothetical protein
MILGLYLDHLEYEINQSTLWNSVLETFLCYPLQMALELNTYDQTLGGYWTDNMSKTFKLTIVLLTTISELHFKLLVLIFVHLYCGAFIMSQDGAYTAITYSSHYFQWQNGGNSEAR